MRFYFASCGSEAQWAAYNWIGWEQSPSRSLKSRTLLLTFIFICHWPGSNLPRWWKVAVEKFPAFAAGFSATASQLKWNTWKPTYSNLTMPNSCPNDEWRERFQTRGFGCLAKLPFIQFEFISFSFPASPFTQSLLILMTIKNEENLYYIS